MIKRRKNRVSGLSEEDLRRFYGLWQFVPPHDDRRDDLWQEHREAILEYVNQRAEADGTVASRPVQFWQELEAQHERRLVATYETFSHRLPDGTSPKIIEDVYETDFDFLKRLCLLAAWEIEKGPPGDHYTDKASWRKMVNWKPAETPIKTKG